MEPTIQISTVFWMFMVWDALILFTLIIFLIVAGFLVKYVREIRDDNKKSLKCLEELAKTKNRIRYI